MHSFLFLLLLAAPLVAAPVTFDNISERSGRWSDPATWGGRQPAGGANVQIKAGHVVTFDVETTAALRVVHVAGTLTFSRTQNTLLEVGLLRVTPGETCSEDGFDCHDDAPATPTTSMPSLEIGTPSEPMPANVKCVIRLHHFPDMNRETLPAIVACGGRWEMHGAPVARTWLKLAATVPVGGQEVQLAEPPNGWKPGDHVIVTGSNESDYQLEVKKAPNGTFAGATEERLITKITGAILTLDRPLTYAHLGEGILSSEVALLSHNVVVESAAPDGVRGHTMYHRDSAGGISYAEFRHLGKKGVLGKYPIHFHLARDTMRGSGVTGASVWDSDNRWITVHGSDHLLVRDCVGYRSRGHGFFLEDATEQWNVFDRNLAVQAIGARPLPKQALPFDQNEGAGFWWANGRNSFTRNVSCENEEYGYRFELHKSSGFDPHVRLRGLTGEPEDLDVRAVPFLKFEDNESHTEGLYSFNFGFDKHGEIHGDKQHPFIVRNLRAWETHYVLRPDLQYFLCEGLRVKNAVYGIYHPDYDAHVYRDLDFDNINSEPINRGHDDASIQYGNFTYERLTLANCKVGRDPLIQMACTAPVAGVSGYFKDLKISNCKSNTNVVDLGGGPRNDQLEHPVSYHFINHNSKALGLETEVPGDLLVMSDKFPEQLKQHDFGNYPHWTGPSVRAAVVKPMELPALLEPIDDLPPATLITSIRRQGNTLRISGVSHDNGTITQVTINASPATITAQHPGLADWEITLPAVETITARAIDQASNAERWPQVVRMSRK